MQELSGHSLEFFLITATLLGIVISTGILFLILVTYRDRSKSRYDEERHEARLSAMRETFERQLQSVTAQLMATEQRWRDVNHLLVSAQRRQPEKIETQPVPRSRFLQSTGISNELPIDNKLVLVLTPFDQAHEADFRTIVEVCRSAGFHCVRGDEENISEDILSHVLKIMVRARFVIANIGSRNPNVYYELGIAQALDKPTILISRTIEGVSFDVSARRILIYENQTQLREGLLQMVARIASEGSSTPVVVPTISEIYDMLSSRVQRILREMPPGEDYRAAAVEQIEGISRALGLRTKSVTMSKDKKRVQLELENGRMSITPSSFTRTIDRDED